MDYATPIAATFAAILSSAPHFGVTDTQEHIVTFESRASVSLYKIPAPQVIAVTEPILLPEGEITEIAPPFTPAVARQATKPKKTKSAHKAALKPNCNQ